MHEKLYINNSVIVSIYRGVIDTHIGFTLEKIKIVLDFGRDVVEKTPAVG